MDWHTENESGKKIKQKRKAMKTEEKNTNTHKTHKNKLKEND